jgi:protein-S-isoprenylcysteine O-methyltransferase Ste14
MGVLVTTGNFWFRYRNFLFPALALLVFLPGPEIFRASIDAALLGLTVASLGQLVRAGTIGFKYVIRGGKDRRVYAEDLVTEGIYAHCRNPMYVGNLLILGGVATASNSWACVALAVPLFVFIYFAIVAAEENYLRGKFGAAFDAYCRDVPRWIPRLSGLGETLRSMHFNWRRVIVKEYGTPFGWICGISVIALWNLYFDDGTWVGDEHWLRVLFTTVAIAVVAWATARFLKKSKRIVAD